MLKLKRPIIASLPAFLILLLVSSGNLALSPSEDITTFIHPIFHTVTISLLLSGYEQGWLGRSTDQSLSIFGASYLLGAVLSIFTQPLVAVFDIQKMIIVTLLLFMIIPFFFTWLWRKK